ncbi:swr1 complex component [Claviceps africana]|uniref:DNA helicase n=1 Tax=Claviceps africana TaxID=83212 RepID=A0A8K0J7M2_9HYPO|nr:swr1 complex component [Claviceps africana]
MAETASPNNRPAIEHLQHHETAIAANGSHQSDAATAETIPDAAFEPSEADAPAVADAPRQTNGHVPPQTNGDNHDHAAYSERPTKRRRTQGGTPPPTMCSARKPKPISPPWKRIVADGPTTFQENGRRKSGRINTLPIELQPPSTKRLTRGSLGSKSSPPKTNKHSITPNRTHGNKLASAKKTTPATKSAARKQPPPPPSVPRGAPRTLRRRTPSPSSHPTRQSARTRRSSRWESTRDEQTEDADYESTYASLDDSRQPPRIKLRVSRSTIIPLVHPDQVPKRAKIGTDFEDFWNRAGTIAVEDGGLFASEDGPSFTDESALRDARMVLRIEHEVEPGGILSVGRCSLFAPEGEEEVPRQWARHDHMLKAMANFRRLLLAEQQRHRAAAKKLAEACRDEWVRRQPKSAEQLEAEAREKWALRYRLVIRAIFGTWDNVRAQVNRQRLEQWEAEEQKRVKAALNEAVSLSEQKLQARRSGLDSEQPSDEEGGDEEEEDGFDDLSDSGSAASKGDADESILESDAGSADSDDDRLELDSDNMSTSDEDEDEDEDEGGGGGDGDIKDVADEGLTQEELRAKYANLPDLSPGYRTRTSTSLDASDPTADATDLSDEGSDESIDMDDDLGSSDMDSDDEAGDELTDDETENSDAGDDESHDEDTTSLLALFFGKSELKQIKQEAVDESHANVTETSKTDLAMEDGDAQTHPGDAGASIDQEGATILSSEDEEDSTADQPLANGDMGDGHHATATSPGGATAMNGISSEPSSADRPEPAEVNGQIQKGNAPDDDLSMMDLHDDLKSGSQNIGANATAKQCPTPPSVLATNSTSPRRSPSPAKLQKKPDDVEMQASSEVVRATADTPRSPLSSHKTDIPSLLRGTLREYQHDGLDWLAGLYANNTNGILADEMGLGKTIQTIALLAHLACHHHAWGPHLVVVPTSVMLNWEMEFKKWCPGFKILAYYGSQEERKRKRQGWNNDDVWNVCITSYQLVLQDQQVFKRRRWHFMVLDEAHNIKNFKSQRWQTLLGFNTRARLLLTGTPLQNNLTELWSLLFFLMPAENGVGGFADLQEFQDWFHKPESQILESGRDQMDEEAKAIISKLHKVLRPYLLRRLKADVEKQMPAKYEHVEFCRLSKRQRELYDGFLSRSETKETLSSGNYLSIINCLMQLRKVCNHPDLFIDRPIMTSFRMSKSVPAEYTFTEQTLRRLLRDGLMSTVNLGFLNLVPTQHESLSNVVAERVAQLSLHRPLMDLREAQRTRAQAASTTLDPTSVESSISYLESASRWGRFEELQHCVYLNALRRQQRPIYGKNVIDLLSIDAYKRPCRPKPRLPQKLMSWLEGDLACIRALTPTLVERAENLKSTISKFSCVTPRVVTRDLEEVLLGRQGVQAFTEEDIRLSEPVRWAPFLPKQPPADPWHEARMTHSIQFPDKRLLQYDCGKLQVLDKLLRRLQSGGHRALIFTQMTKVLDILEQFLNIHGHKYLRLDGATKVEQRQILTDRFNNDPRILCFILSTRSGGLGINLTGADTVIFYDQDWNPAMDKQCQDRCHRIGQTRDVHIYRLVSEHTIEANILRKASQKQMLDDVVIQEGEFTTDYFNRVSVRDVLEDKVDFTDEGVAAADAALDRVLGGPDTSRDQRTVGRALEQAEDREDVAAARVAEREIEADDADFTEKISGPASGTSTARQGTPAGKSVVMGEGLDMEEMAATVDDEMECNAWGERMGNIDQYMLTVMAEELKHTKLELPKDKRKSKKKGRDMRKR